MVGQLLAKSESVFMAIDTLHSKVVGLGNALVAFVGERQGLGEVLKFGQSHVDLHTPSQQKLGCCTRLELLVLLELGAHLVQRVIRSALDDRANYRSTIKIDWRKKPHGQLCRHRNYIYREKGVDHSRVKQC